jgi:hypothetical protein
VRELQHLEDRVIEQQEQITEQRDEAGAQALEAPVGMNHGRVQQRDHQQHRHERRHDAGDAIGEERRHVHTWLLGAIEQ